MSSFVFHWKVENFSVSEKRFDLVTSPVFCAENIDNSQWYLNLYMNYKYTGKISCFLWRSKDDAEENIEIDYTLKFIKVQKCSKVFVKEYVRYEIGVCRGFHNILDRSYLCHENQLNTFSIELHMRSRKYRAEFKIDCFAVTKYGGEIYTHLWNVKNFDTTAKKNFILTQFINLALELRLSDEKVKIKLKLKEPLEEERYMGAKLSFLDAEKNVIVSFKDSRVMQKTDGEWCFPEFIEKNLQMNSAKINGAEFSLQCEFFVASGIVSSKLDYVISDSLKEDNAVNILTSDFQQMYGSQMFSDVTLRIANETFSAHRCVLSARSPVLYAMFSQDMLEKQSGVVDIGDVHPKPFAAFLKFIYTGTVDILDSDMALNLLLIANKYQVASLEKKCSYFLMSNLSHTNVCDIVRVADMIEQKILKNCGIRFLKSNADTILSTSEWNKIIESNVKLCSEIMKELSSDLCTSYE